MTWRRAFQQELGFAVGFAAVVAILTAIFGAGFLLGAALYRQITLQQGQQLDATAARHCIYLQPQAPRHAQ